jgi:hypothetical protein
MYLHCADFMPVDWHPQIKGETARMKHLGLAVILACVLWGTASAGEIPTTGASAPKASSSAVTPGEIPTGDRTGEILSTGGTASEASSTLITLILTLLTIGR